MTAAPILAKLEALPKARQVRPGAWVGCCPAHEDASPSLSWTMSKEGNALVKCFAECSAEAVVAALDATMRDLFAPANGVAGQAKPARRLVARYDYHNADGSLAYYVERWSDKVVPDSTARTARSSATRRASRTACPSCSHRPAVS